MVKRVPMSTVCWSIGYYITHKSNIVGIWGERALLSRNAVHRTHRPTEIADPEVNLRRKGKVDPIYG